MTASPQTEIQQATQNLTIYTAGSHNAKKYSEKTLTWPELCETLHTPKTTSYTKAEYDNKTPDQQKEIKNVGGFVGGTLQNGKRSSTTIINRHLLTLDADYADQTFIPSLTETFPYEYLCYPTISHTPEKPRYRLVAPLTHPVTPEEYEYIARKICHQIGMAFFDPSTGQPERLMYWPTRHKGATTTIHTPTRHLEWLNPDDILTEGWQDRATWPKWPNETSIIKKQVDEIADPLTRPGLIGAFNQAYTIADAINAFLADIYIPTSNPNRYTYTKGSSVGGLVIYPKNQAEVAYSNHATDPIAGHAVNAFDLVRIHRFGDRDPNHNPNTPVYDLPSYKRMEELARTDTKVKNTDQYRQYITERNNLQIISAQDEFDILDEENSPAPKGDQTTRQIIAKLELNKDDRIRPTLNNYVTIVRCDPRLQTIRLDTFSQKVAVTGKLPWKQANKGQWSDTDHSSLLVWISNKYGGITVSSHLEHALTTVALERQFHPVKDYLNSLPEWDELPRVETLLIDYLGATDTPYVRSVTRKTLVAAVARIFQPGIKFDTVLILCGPQGIGKSTIFAKLGGKWFNDSITLTDMRDKTAAEKMQGSWILELGELAGIRNVDAENIKGFLSKQNDKYRPAYGRNTIELKRQSIFVGTTNAVDGFLRDTTGNRRFWPVIVGLTKTEQHPWDMDEETIQQIWAEAIYYYKQGETVTLPKEIAQAAEEAQKEALETYGAEGLIEEFVNMPRPPEWAGKSIEERREYFKDYLAGTNFTGEIPERITLHEIWVEALGRSATDFPPSDRASIQRSLEHTGEWVGNISSVTGRRQRAEVTHYGKVAYWSRATPIATPENNIDAA